MTAVAEKEPMSVDLGGDATACLTKITDAFSQITRFTYDPVTGNLLTTTDPLNQTTTMGREMGSVLDLALRRYLVIAKVQTQELTPVLPADPSGLIDKRPCGAEIDRCIAETRNSPLGGCLGTAYGLYFGGDTSNCKKGIFTRDCLRKDQLEAVLNCGNLGPFPKSCTDGIGRCIENDPRFKK